MNSHSIESLNSYLFNAILKNNIHDVKYFLHAGADINARWWLHDLTPLMLTIIRGYTEIATFLIDKGADVNLQSYHGNTALHYAINNKSSIDLLSFLISKGSKKDIENISMHTPCSISKFIYDYEEMYMNVVKLQRRLYM